MTAVLIKERPILFSSPMVHAILAGRKSQTRRVATVPEYVRGSEAPQKKRGEPQKHLTPYFDAYNGGPMWCWWDEYDRSGDGIKCPYGVTGDHLWVRETWAKDPDAHPEEAGALYRATDPDWDENDSGLRWKPSIFMPRWASRITLEITNIRVERVQDISEEVAIAEGSYLGKCSCQVMQQRSCTPVEAMFRQTWCHVHGDEFKHLWQSINGKRAPWDSNPFVWVVAFRRVTP